MNHEGDRRDEPQQPGRSDGWSAPGGGWSAPGSGTPQGPPPGYGGPQGPPPGYGGHQGPPPGGPPPQGPPPGYGGPQGPPPGYWASQGPPPPGYGGPQYGPTPYGQPQGGQPLKPGLVPLRPLGLGDILNGAFALIRNHPATTLGLAFVVMAISATISTLLSSWFLAEYERSLDQFVNGPVPSEDPMLSISSGSVLLMLLGTVVSYLATTLLTALLTSVVGMAVLGHKRTVSQVWATIRSRIWAILGLSVLQSLIHAALAVAAIVLTMGGALFGTFLVAVGSEALGAVIALGSVLLGFFGGLVLFAWIGIRIYLSMPIVVLERLGPGRALARSWRLTRGNWWRMLGIVALTLLLVFGVFLILTLALGLLAGLPEALVGGDWGIVAANVLGVVAEALSSSITTPFFAAVTTLLYIDLRMRREGLDLRLHWVAQQGVPVGPEIYHPERYA